MKNPPERIDQKAFHQALLHINDWGYPGPLFYILRDCKILADCKGQVGTRWQDNQPEVSSRSKWGQLRNKLKLIRHGTIVQHETLFDDHPEDLEFNGQIYRVRTVYTVMMMFIIWKVEGQNRFFLLATVDRWGSAVEIEISEQEVGRLLRMPKWESVTAILNAHGINR